MTNDDKQNFYLKKISRYYKKIQQLTTNLYANILHISVGDIYFFETVNDVEEERKTEIVLCPYLIVEMKNNLYYGYACTLETQPYYTGQFYCLNNDKYQIGNHMYIDLTRKWELNEKHVRQYLFTADTYDLDCIKKRNTSNYNLIDNLIETMNQGNIIETVNGKKYYLIKNEISSFLGHFLYTKKNKPDKVHLYEWIHESAIYYIDFDKTVEISYEQIVSRFTQFSKTEKEKIHNYLHLEEVEDNPRKAFVKGLSILYPIGTVFYDKYDDSYFIYLCSRKSIIYGVLENEWVENNAVLRKIKTYDAEKVGILEKEVFMELLYCVHQKLQNKYLMDFLIENYRSPDVSDALYRVEE